MSKLLSNIHSFWSSHRGKGDIRLIFYYEYDFYIRLPTDAGGLDQGGVEADRPSDEYVCLCVQHQDIEKVG